MRFLFVQNHRQFAFGLARNFKARLSIEADCGHILGIYLQTDGRKLQLLPGIVNKPHKRLPTEPLAPESVLSDQNEKIGVSRFSVNSREPHKSDRLPIAFDGKKFLMGVRLITIEPRLLRLHRRSLFGIIHRKTDSFSVIEPFHPICDIRPNMFMYCNIGTIVYQKESGAEPFISAKTTIEII